MYFFGSFLFPLQKQDDYNPYMAVMSLELRICSYQFIVMAEHE